MKTFGPALCLLLIFGHIAALAADIAGWLPFQLSRAPVILAAAVAIALPLIAVLDYTWRAVSRARAARRAHPIVGSVGRAP